MALRPLRFLLVTPILFKNITRSYIGQSNQRCQRTGSLPS